MSNNNIIDTLKMLGWFAAGGISIYAVYKTANKLANLPKFKLIPYIGPEINPQFNEAYLSIPGSLLVSLLLSRYNAEHKAALWLGALAGFATYKVLVTAKPAAEDDKKKIDQYLDPQIVRRIAQEEYAKNKQELIEAGSWKFPGHEFANYLAPKYGLDEEKRDVIASYNDLPRYAQSIANVLTGAYGGPIVSPEQVMKEFDIWQKSLPPQIQAQKGLPR